MENPFLRMILEFHILQSMPVSCLNRDDNNQPKTAVIGRVQRARVSSQCWKRAVREELSALGCPRLGVRTKKLEVIMAEALKKSGLADENKAAAIGRDIGGLLIKSKEIGGEEGDEMEAALAGTENTDSLIFISNEEAMAIARIWKERAYDTKDVFAYLLSSGKGAKVD